MLHTVDSDVVVLAVSVFDLLENTEIWIAFGTEKHLRFIHAHDILTVLGKKKAHALSMFHSLTGVLYITCCIQGWKHLGTNSCTYVPSLELWGWKRSTAKSWEPLWTLLP